MKFSKVIVDEVSIHQLDSEGDPETPEIHIMATQQNFVFDSRRDFVYIETDKNEEERIRVVFIAAISRRPATFTKTSIRKMQMGSSSNKFSINRNHPLHRV